GGKLAVIDPRDYRGGHDIYRDAGIAKRADGTQARLGRTRARFHYTSEFGIERRDGKRDADRVVLGELLEEINVTAYQCVLRDDADRLIAFGRHGDARARDLELSLGRLVTIGDARERDRLR